MGRNFEPIRCPWEHEHSTKDSDDTATVWFHPGVNGFERGHFKCMHVSCLGRTDDQFLDAVGYTTHDMSKIDEEEEEVQKAFALERLTDQTRRGVSPIEGPRFTRDKNGGILWDSPNVEEALRHPEFCGFLISYDVFLDDIMVAPIGKDGMPGRIRPVKDTDYSRFISRCRRKGFKLGYQMTMVRNSFDVVAEEREVDSAKDWLNGLPEWDRVRRIDSFCSTYLGAEPSPYSTAVGRYWWTAHAGRVLDPGCQADMAICLISAQGTGKTSTVKAVVPNDEWFCELDFNREDDDLSRSMRGKLIGELAELRGLSDGRHDSIKARVSRRKESWIVKYKEKAHTFYRRLVLVATGNNPEFLSDETGNRRWLPIEVGARQDIDRLVQDRDQLWAEAAHLWRDGGVQWKDAQLLGRNEHSSYEVHDAWEEVIGEWLTTEGIGGDRPMDWEFITITQVLEGALRIEPNKQQLRDQHRIGRAMKRLGYEKRQKRDGERRIKAWFKA